MSVAGAILFQLIAWAFMLMALLIPGEKALLTTYWSIGTMTFEVRLENPLYKSLACTWLNGIAISACDSYNL